MLGQPPPKPATHSQPPRGKAIILPTQAPAVEAFIIINYKIFFIIISCVSFYRNIPPTILVRSNAGAQCTNTELIAGQNAPLNFILFIILKDLRIFYCF